MSCAHDGAHNRRIGRFTDAKEDGEKMTWVSFFRSDSCTFSSRVGHEPRIGTHTHTKLFTRLQRFIRQGRCIALYSATRADTINIRWVVLVTRFPFFQWGLDVIDAGITTRLPR